jgi:membrane-associated protease RseP (regulator of RpoE activity)
MQNETFEMQRSLLYRIAAEVMDVQSVAAEKGAVRGVVQFEGTLHREPKAAYDYLEQHFGAVGYTALLRQEGDKEVLVAMPGKLAASRSRLWLAILLFVLTVISTIVMGGLEQVGNQVTINMGTGIAFSASILSILLAHELGHYITARKLGVAASYPFFIPMPLSPIGTMGAFIAMKSPPPDRRALLAIAIAGPIAGLVVAIPVLFIGLYLSNLEPLPPPPYFIEGNSLLYVAMKVAVFGKFLPQASANGGGVIDVMLHPVAFAGWVGLLVTGLNLIPAGQLDGGHILYALLGPQIAQKVTWTIVGFLLIAGFLWWYGWFIWAVLIFLLGRHRATLLNELVPLTRWQQMLAVFGLVLFVLVFTPTPITVVQPEPLL